MDWSDYPVCCSHRWLMPRCPTFYPMSHIPDTETLSHISVGWSFRRHATAGQMLLWNPTFSQNCKESREGRHRWDVFKAQLQNRSIDNWNVQTRRPTYMNQQNLEVYWFEGKRDMFSLRTPNVSHTLCTGQAGFVFFCCFFHCSVRIINII